MIFKRKKDLQYYAKKYGKINCIYSVYTKKLISKETTRYAVFINKGTRDIHRDWLRYIGSFDMMFILNEDFKIEKIGTEIILDVSPFIDGKRYNFKKPLNLDIMEKDKMIWEETNVWDI